MKREVLPSPPEMRDEEETQSTANHADIFSDSQASPPKKNFRRLPPGVLQDLFIDQGGVSFRKPKLDRIQQFAALPLEHRLSVTNVVAAEHRVSGSLRFQKQDTWWKRPLYSEPTRIKQDRCRYGSLKQEIGRS